MSRPGTVVATRLVGIRYALTEDESQPGGVRPADGFESIIFELEQDVSEGEGPPVQHLAEINPSNTQQQGFALRAWDSLQPLLIGRFLPGHGRDD